MAVSTITYSSPATVTITYTSLADGGYQESTAVNNNSTTNYIDCLVGGLIRIGAVSADGTIQIYAYGSYDGTEYTAGMTGTDNTIAWGTDGRTGVDSYNNLPLLGVVVTDALDDVDSSSEYIPFGPYSIAQCFGGTVPTKWGIVVKNSTGAAFHATQTSSECQYIGVTYTTA